MDDTLLRFQSKVYYDISIKEIARKNIIQILEETYNIIIVAKMPYMLSVN